MHKTLLLIIPHTRKAQGAITNVPLTSCAMWNNYVVASEYDVAEMVLYKTAQICKDLGIDTLVVNRDQGWREVQKAAARVFNKGIVEQDIVHLSLELHFNSVGNKRACGTEILIQEEDVITARAGATLASSFAEAYDLYLRRGNGVKRLDEDDRGNKNLSRVDRIAVHEVLFEPFFGSNSVDVAKVFTGGPALFAARLAECINKAFFRF